METETQANFAVEERSLVELMVGETGIVRRVVVAAEDYARLAVLGLCPGRRIEVLQTGQRMVVRSGETCLGIHPEIAAKVRVSA